MTIPRPIPGPILSPLTRAVTAGGGGALPFYGVMSNPPTITTTDAAGPTIPSGTRFGSLGAGAANLKYSGPPTMTFAADTSFRIAGDGVTTDGGAYVVYEFMSTAPQVELLFLRFNSKFDIRIDGQLLQSAQFSYDSAGSRRLVKLDWSADANPTKNRLYRVAGYNLPFGGGWTTAGGSVTYPTARDSVPLMVFLGDSYTQGTGANGPDQVYADTLAIGLGYDYWGDGLGGAGWNTASPNDPVSRINKRIAILERTPAVIVTALGYNDAGGNMTTLATNYDAAITLLKSEWPGVPIVSLGPWTPLGTTANLDTVAGTISGRAAANTVDFVAIADIINATNKAEYTGGDNVHANAAGHNYLGRRIAYLTRAALAT